MTSHPDLGETMLELITELQAIAQSGLAYCKDPFDIERYHRITQICARLIAEKSNENYEHVLALFEQERGYATPKIDVRGAVFKDGKILLIKEKSDQLWTLPGGWADINLSPSENIIKEILEETGYQSRVVKLIGLFDKQKMSGTKIIQWPHVYKLFFLCELDSVDQQNFDPNEVISIDFFGQNELPELSLQRTNVAQLKLCFAHYDNCDLASVLD